MILLTATMLGKENKMIRYIDLFWPSFNSVNEPLTSGRSRARPGKAAVQKVSAH